MCDNCALVQSGLGGDPPELIPPMVDDGMIPPATVQDDIDRAIVTIALKQFAHDYIDAGEHIASLDSTDVIAQLIIMSNMVNVTDRVGRLIDSIGNNVIKPVNDNGES